MAARKNKEVTSETRAKLSRAMKGKRNAAGPHEMSPQGLRNIKAAQRKRHREAKG